MTGEGSDADHDATPKRRAAPADSTTPPKDAEPSVRSADSDASSAEEKPTAPSASGEGDRREAATDPAAVGTDDASRAVGDVPEGGGTDKPGEVADTPDGHDEAGDRAGVVRPARRRRIAAAPAAAGRRVRAGVTGIGNGYRSGRASIRRAFTLAGDRILRRSEAVNDRAAVLALAVFGLGIFALLVGFTTKWTVYGVAVTFFDGQSVSVALMITAGLIGGATLLTGRYHLLTLAPTFSAAALVVLAAELIEGPLGAPKVTVGFGGYAAAVVGLIQCIVGAYATAAAGRPTTRFFVPHPASVGVVSGGSAGPAPLAGRQVESALPSRSTPESLGDVVAVPAWESEGGAGEGDRSSRVTPGNGTRRRDAGRAGARNESDASDPAARSAAGRSGATPAVTTRSGAARSGADDPADRYPVAEGYPVEANSGGLDARNGNPGDRYPGNGYPANGYSSDGYPGNRDDLADRPTDGDRHPNDRYPSDRYPDDRSPDGSHADDHDRGSDDRDGELVGYGADRRRARDLDAAGIDVPRYLGPPRGSPQANYPLPGGDGGRRPTRPQYRYGASMGASPYRRPRNPAEAYPVLGEQGRQAAAAPRPAPGPSSERPPNEESPAMDRRQPAEYRPAEGRPTARRREEPRTPEPTTPDSATPDFSAPDFSAPDFSAPDSTSPEPGPRDRRSGETDAEQPGTREAGAQESSAEESGAEESGTAEAGTETPPGLERSRVDAPRAETPPAIDRAGSGREGAEGGATSRASETPPPEEPPTIGRAPG